MLQLVVPGFTGSGRSHRPPPFERTAPGFFNYLREERGVREQTVRHYEHQLRALGRYLDRIELHDLSALTPAVLSAYLVERCPGLARSGRTGVCACLRVFLRYLHREGIVRRDLSGTIEYPKVYRLASLPRSIPWSDVRRVLESVDRRSVAGKRDYAILLLLVTYGLRAREVASLTLDDVDWKEERLYVPQRKADHTAAFPLSPIVGEALLDYLQHGRPKTELRAVFFRTLAPRRPLTHAAVSARASHHLRRIGLRAPRLGSHTLRHSCVQCLVDAHFTIKEIGDYVGHRSPESTAVYSKIDVDKLREVALGSAGEELL
jgi:site-specific recombinase XerD